MFGVLDFIYLLCHSEKNRGMEKQILSIPEQVKKALDGRTQRWLSFEAKIGESELSKKMNGEIEFTEPELERIETRLSVKIKK